jgi:hypothetical protein
MDIHGWPAKLKKHKDDQMTSPFLGPPLVWQPPGGLRVGGPGAELIVGACEPAAGRFGASTEIILADQVLQVFQKVHILPYKASIFDDL